MLLTESNYTKGFLVDDETIAGVTAMGGSGDSVFAAYVSHALTGETLAYAEFDSPTRAFEYLEAIGRTHGRRWGYEAVGCSKTAKSSSSSSQTTGAGGCGTGGCSGCAC